MSDYNDGLLPEPCLRMDTHFGDEYESVEFGDGTGYVKAAPTLARLGALHVELDELRGENAKLRESLERAAGIIVDICGECHASRYDWLSSDGCAEKCWTVTEDECWIAYLTGKRWNESGAEVDA